MQASPVFSLSRSSPSFSSYSSSSLNIRDNSSSVNLAEIAARVVQELRNDSDNIFNWEDDDDDDGHGKNFFLKQEIKPKDDEEDEEGEFEFAVANSSPISADDIFYNGQIKPIYPLFNTDLLLDDDQTIKTDSISTTAAPSSKPSRLPLRTLMREERETTTSCSSSEADDLDNLNPETFCVWKPKDSHKEKEGKCKKSNSTGSSKRWKFRDFLYRSNSDGKDTFVFLTQSHGSSSSKKSEKLTTAAAATADHEERKLEKGIQSRSKKIVEEHYVRNRAMKEEDKRKSYLPYRQDLMGLFNNVNGLSRNLHPF